MRRLFTLIADDYALAPGVSGAILELIAAGRLSGTSCMTLFDEWRQDAPALKALCDEGRAQAGLHLTLTDFEPLSGRGPLGTGRMPNLRQLLQAAVARKVDETAVHGELDAQLEAFVEAIGRMPDYLDGHQHVHFLPFVRRWLEARAPGFAAAGSMPWLRGAPSVSAAQGVRIRLKATVVARMAAGYDRQMARAGYDVRGPLLGFYDWNRPEGFAPMIESLAARGGEGLAGGVVMCHPGRADAMLKSRDRLIAAREAEFAYLREHGIGHPV